MQVSTLTAPSFHYHHGNYTHTLMSLHEDTCNSRATKISLQMYAKGVITHL